MTRSRGTVSIVGTGQIGTMLGLALSASGAGPVLFDSVQRTALESLARGAGSRVADSLDEALAADTVVLAMPVSEILRTLAAHRGDFREGSLVIDTGSAKAAVVEAMRALPAGVHAMGGHPLAGTERPGPDGADMAQLSGATFALCPVRDDPEALTRAQAFAASLGARSLVIDAVEHDRAIARTSGLPHLVAFALMRAALATRTDLAAGGFRGAVRLARSDPRMVASFLSANSGEVRSALSELGAELAALGELLDDEAALASALARARS